MSRFLELLEKQSVILFDGAMGTMLYTKGFYINRCFDELNLSAPQAVREIHAEYVRSGVDAIETNTFGANRYKLEPHGFADKVAEINSQGARLAREAAGHEVLVAGAIGPLGLKIEPWGPTSVDEARDAFRQQAQALLEGGVDLFLLETFSDLSELQQALKGVREIANLPVIAQMTIGDEGNSLYGTNPETFTARLDQWGANVIGLNCSVGPQIMLETIERMLPVTKKPLSAMPNAGVPRAVEGRNIYLASNEYLAEYAKRFIQTGVRILGGCCGTTPAHIKAMKSAVRALAPGKIHVAVTAPVAEASRVKPVPSAEKSRFAAKVVGGEFVTSVELTPPKGCDPTKILAAARALKEAGVDAINLPDGPRASARMSPLAVALLMQQQAGIEAVLHYCCRDRNILGMQSDLLGAAALGINNVLLITGDPPKMGEYPDATAVFDVDAIGLTNIVHAMNHGRDMGGNAIAPPTRFFIGVGVNPGAIDLHYELSRFRWKVKAGAEFAITQPVFDLVLLRNFLDKIGDVRIPILAGIWPLASLRNAEFMNNEVPGASVPAEIMERMKKADSADKARAEGVKIAQETLLAIKPLIQGAQVSAPFGRHQTALEVLQALK